MPPGVRTDDIRSPPSAEEAPASILQQPCHGLGVSQTAHQGCTSTIAGAWGGATTVQFTERQQSGGQMTSLRRVEVALQLELLGKLNPSIFTPRWFASEHLLRLEEASAARDIVEEDDFVSFRTADFAIEVTRQRFVLFSRNQALDLTHRDLVVNLFLMLRHTPLQTLTITRLALLGPEAGDTGDLLWERLLLTEPWAEVLTRPAPDRVTITGEGPAGYPTELTAETSGRPDAPLLVRCTYDRVLTEAGSEMESAEPLGSTLKNEWELLVDHSDRVISHIGDLLWSPRPAEQRDLD